MKSGNKGESMNHKLTISLLICMMGAILFGAVFAEETYTFELTEAVSYFDGNDDWYVRISVPQISGMADEDEQKDLNESFLAEKDEIIADYERDAAFAEQSKAEGNAPHFCYDFSYEMVTDTDDYFVFRTIWFMAAGSSSTVNEYYTFDKKTGELVDFDDIVTSDEEMLAIRNQIFAEMTEINETDEGMYWLEDDNLDISLGQVEYLKHWYINSDGDLVITFDKYEIAPGAMGDSEFVISSEPAAAE